jgi:outer membrane immunogenic protein
MSGGGALAQPVPVDWSGFYAAGFVGATMGNADVKSSAGQLVYFDATDARQISRVGDNDLDQWRPSGGLAGGFSKQFGRVVMGLEVSANTLFLDDEHISRQQMDANPGSQSTIRQSIKADWMATVRPRLGWAEDNWLGYVTGGLAVTQLQAEFTYTDNAFSGFSRSSKEHVLTGMSLGLGGEYALNQDWAIRGEYLYTRFEKLKSVSPVTSTNNPGGTMVHSADLDTHGLYIGVVYRFSGL